MILYSVYILLTICISVIHSQQQINSQINHNPTSISTSQMNNLNIQKIQKQQQKLNREAEQNKVNKQSRKTNKIQNPQNLQQNKVELNQENIIIQQEKQNKKQNQQIRIQIPKIQEVILNQEQIKKQQRQIEQIEQEDNKLEPLTQQQQKEELKVQKQQKQILQQEKTQLINKLSLWIQNEKIQNDNIPKFNGISERFEFLIQTQQFKHFYMDASKIKSEKSIYLQIDVFVDQNQVFTVPNNPQQQTYLSFSISSKINQNQINQFKKNIYLKYQGYYTPTHQGIYYLNFQNLYTETVAIKVMVQIIPNQIQSINKATIDPYTNRLAEIIQTIKSQGQKRKFSYKWQSGFKEKQGQHQANMLILAALELLAILLTAMIELFYLRNLLENRSIV